jgi:hypothetical protein
MTWILVLFAFRHGGVEIEYSTKEACLTAMEQVVEESNSFTPLCTNPVTGEVIFPD